MSGDNDSHSWCSLSNEFKKRHTRKDTSSDSRFRNSPINFWWAIRKNKFYSQVPPIHDNEIEVNTTRFWKENWAGLRLLFELRGLFFAHSIHLFESRQEPISIIRKCQLYLYNKLNPHTRQITLIIAKHPIFWSIVNYPKFCTARAKH